MFLKISATYDEARQKLRAAEDTSNLETDDKLQYASGRQKRKRKSTVKSLDDDEDDDNEDVQPRYEKSICHKAPVVVSPMDMLAPNRNDISPSLTSGLHMERETQINVHQKYEVHICHHLNLKDQYEAEVITISLHYIYRR